MKEIIYTENAPKPIGPYSQAIKVTGELLFISGQIPIDNSGNIVGNNISEQTQQVIKNIESILKSQNLSLNNIIKTTVLLKDMNDFAEMNKVYEDWFRDSKPARAAYQVARLPKDVLIEIEAIAVYSL